ncbi:hypothetical protein MBLNU230_g6079t1 [Neophaeotheca triangularis]
MVSFSCENCGDVLTKKKLDPHRNQCRGASFTCIDCMVHFNGTEYRSHTTCMSEAQKYMGHLYRGEKQDKKNAKRRSNGVVATQGLSQAVAMPGSFNAYVEDAPEGDEGNAVAVVDVPPRAPTPPPAAAALEENPENVNVFDFLVADSTPNASKVQLGAPDERKMVGNGDNHDSQYSQFSNGTGSQQYLQRGWSYGNAPVEPSFQRYDSWQNMTDSQQSNAAMPPPMTTPGPRSERKDKKERHTDKKRKRHQVEELDLSSVKRPSSRDNDMTDAPSSVQPSGGRVLHSGLTGGLNKLVTDSQDYYNDRIDAGPTPISPTKRTKRDNKDSSKDDKRKSSYTSYTTQIIKPSHSSSGREKDRASREDKYRRPDSSHRSSDRSANTVYYDDKHRSHGKTSGRRRDSSPSITSSADYAPRSSRPKALTHATSTSSYSLDRPQSVQPSSRNAVVTNDHYSNKAEMFLSFINKGPESERGCSINKALKRYHREQGLRGEGEKEEEDKELWKGLRVRRNERGEFVLFF